MLKAAIQKCIAAKGGEWSEWLSDVLWAVRSLPSRSHGMSPYRLVFKSEPTWPEHLLLWAERWDGGDTEIKPDDEVEMHR